MFDLTGKMLAPHIRVPGSFPEWPADHGFLLKQTCGSSHDDSSDGSLHLHEGLDCVCCSSSTWPSPACSGDLGNEPVESGTLLFSLSLFACQINNLNFIESTYFEKLCIDTKFLQHNKL